ncbi:MAG: flavin reductase [Acidobacteriota bacterium]|jgi:flavin reductase (DIM6/NTAB) family NADH-FMN oxidoreductase RutF/rubredoxin|nr:flavin reductase [Acidobacteriota bacterium]
MDETALYKISYGLYVVGVRHATAEAGNHFGGCVVDAVAQVSSGKPPMVILGSMSGTRTNKLIKGAGEFTLSVLPENINPFVIANFGFQSATDADKWANVRHTVKDGLPVLDDAVSYLRCKVTEAKDLATHTVFFCEVVDAWKGTSQAKPLIYGDYQGAMKPATVAAFRAYKDMGDIPGSNILDAVKPVAAPTTPAVTPKEGAKWQCRVCGYVYEGEVPFEELPEDWQCPLCGVGKDSFDKI